MKKTTGQDSQGDLVFALDIGTRSIIGLVGKMENDRLHVLAIEKENHPQRAMVDGQIENIDQVSKIASLVKERLEDKLGCQLHYVCVAAAGRALRTQKASNEIELPKVQQLDDELISHLEAGAIGKAEEEFDNQLDKDNSRQFFLVGYSVTQYYLDDYPLSDLQDHHGKKVRADVIATFLPSEVVESLYTAMNKAGMEVTSLTLEPIAAINAAIPQNIRLLNLAMVDIGAGTSDIAISKDGSIIGYTMATIAGDEISEVLMRKYLIDFDTAEKIKSELDQEEPIEFVDILNITHCLPPEEIQESIQDSRQTLCKEITEKILEINGGSAPSAIFLAGGGSKLSDMCSSIAKHLNMDLSRVAIAGNHFKTNAFSDEYDIDDPEYATPLGIAISVGYNMINDGFHVNLNGTRARLFRSGSLTIMDILMMNGYSYQDLLARTGRNVILTLNGERKIFQGEAGTPALLQLNGVDSEISHIVHAGDSIEFTPATTGKSASITLSDITDDPYDALVNGDSASPDTLLKTGDVVILDADIELDSDVEAEPESTPAPVQTTSPEPEPISKSIPVSAPASKEIKTASPKPAPFRPVKPVRPLLHFTLNHTPLELPVKQDNTSYYLMDMLEYSDIDFDNPNGVPVLRVNGKESSFLQELKDGDQVEIYCD